MNDMEELKPKIKPKAPASLKKNVLNAVKQQERPVSRSYIASFRWLSAAAVVITGILSYTLWDKENNSLSPVKEEPINTIVGKKTEIPSLASPNIVFPVHKDMVYVKQTRYRKAKRHHRLSQKQDLLTPVIESPVPEVVLSDEPTITPSVEKQPMVYTEYEQQLIENMEKHSDIVRACLAEELLQADSKQRLIREERKEYIKDALQLYDKIYQQIQENMENTDETDEKEIRQV